MRVIFEVDLGLERAEAGEQMDSVRQLVDDLVELARQKRAEGADGMRLYVEVRLRSQPWDDEGRPLDAS